MSLKSTRICKEDKGMVMRRRDSGQMGGSKNLPQNNRGPRRGNSLGSKKTKS